MRMKHLLASPSHLAQQSSKKHNLIERMNHYKGSKYPWVNTAVLRFRIRPDQLAFVLYTAVNKRGLCFVYCCK